MKTSTLIIASLVVVALVAIGHLSRGTFQAELLDAAVPSALAVDAQPADAAAEEPLVLDEETTAEVEPTMVFPDEEAAEPAAEPAAEAAAEDADLIKLETERELSPGIEVSMGDEGRDLISITLDDVPIQDVVRMFTRISGANIVAGTNLQGRVTVSLQDVEWEPAFRVILDTVGMVMVEKVDGIYTIMSRNELAAEPLTVDTIFLRFTTVSNVLPVVERMLTSTNASVAAFPSANALVVQETAERLNIIKELINEIDKQRPQVYIEAKFVELSEEAIKDLGIDWSVLGSDGSGRVGYTLGASGLSRSFSEIRSKTLQDALAESDTLAFSDFTDSPVGQYDTASYNDSYNSFNADQSRQDSYGGGIIQLGGKNWEEVDFEEGTITTIPILERIETYTAVLSADDFALTLSALYQDEGVDIISNPKVIVGNEETALIHVGRNEPNVVAVPQGDTGDRFAYSLDSEDPFIEIGVKLEVTPTVNTEENITVNLAPELSRLIGEKEVGEGNTRITFPITQIRRVETEFNLQSGNTVAIGGLTETRDQDTVKKVPILGDLPLLGKYLFTHTHTERVQDEVIIFVTVGIANPESLVEVAGVPSEGKLIHKHLADKAKQQEE